MFETAYRIAADDDLMLRMLTRLEAAGEGAVRDPAVVIAASGLCAGCPNGLVAAGSDPP